MKYLIGGLLSIGICLVGANLPLPAQPTEKQTQTVTESVEELIEIGEEQFRQNDYQQALENFQKALTLARQKGDRSSEAITLNNIGFVYHSIGQPQKALEYYNAPDNKVRLA